MNRTPAPPTFLPVLFAALCAAAAPAQEVGPRQRPRLVVLCSVDQLGSWVLAQGLPHCAADGGFRRLLREGMYFTNCAYQHGCSETGPGHATLGTGAPASLHGIVKNQWWDPIAKAEISCVGDSKTEALPEWPEGKGRSACRLLLPTLGDCMKAHLGKAAKVVSVSWKDRSAILMAGASADVAAWVEVKTGQLVTNKAYCETAPAWLVAFDQKKLLDSWFGWNWERIGGADAYAGLVDDRPYELPHGNGSRQHTLPQKMTGGKDAPEAAYYLEAFYSPLGNELVLQAALAALDGAELGRDDVPDLLCVSFSSTDVVGHVFGPDSVEARDCLLRLDRQLAQLLQALDQKVGTGRFLFLLSADHGVGVPPEAAHAAGIDCKRGAWLTTAKAAAEKALVEKFGAREDKSPYVAHASEMALFLDRAGIEKQAGAAGFAAACRLAAEVAGSAPGILTAFVTRELVQQGPGEDPIRRAMYFAAREDRSGDVLLVLRPWWLDGATPASHGTPHPYDREVPLIAAGCGIVAGQRCTARVSPGLGVVLAASVLGVPRPSGAVDEIPDGVFAR
jgi:hypothetical protein